MKARRFVAVIPMKPPCVSKSRLASELSPRQRVALSLNMFKRVVQASVESSIDQVWVIGGDEAVKETCARLGARWRVDKGKDLNDTLVRAFEIAFESDLTPLYLPADLPFLTPDDVSGVVAASEGGRRLTLSPARRDGGTNAIIVPKGCHFRPELGVDSFRRHRHQATALGLCVSIFDSLGLGLDLDTVDDINTFQEIEAGLLERLTV